MEMKFLQLKGFILPVIKMPDSKNLWVLAERDILNKEYCKIIYHHPFDAHVKAMEFQMNGIEAEPRKIGPWFYVYIPETEN